MKHAEADALARELMRLRRSGLTEAVLHALRASVEAEKAKASLPDVAVAFARELRALDTEAA
ncbi:type II toxin-antitoxin system VapB family antitoxin [Aureimonas leprariae]|uniref:type II toxin-antitoxin system VapB family antitoxin n=1 Tax=Plantimonas leprariae TaxID=2615207 RepID=UPI001386D2B2|nr:type II toxin-antitoxin system VapB family antitoxin [Aureimonas leprariae]